LLLVYTLVFDTHPYVIYVCTWHMDILYSLSLSLSVYINMHT
jgi:hypothetical protein